MISTPERGFEIPFCQLLISEGHRIVHIDSHSQQEEGKDILAVDPDGRLCGYQLKRGDVNVTRWRSEIQGELQELVELPAHHPSFAGQLCRPYLVITGTLNQPALSRLRGFNDSAANRGFDPVGLIDRHSLLSRFRTCQDIIWPTEPSDFKSLLELMLADGRENLDRRKFASVLESLLSDEIRKVRTGEARRRIAAALSMAAYAMASHVEARNHLAEAEGWILAASRVARAAAVATLHERHWEGSLKLACDAAAQALHRLTAEALQNTTLMEGKVLGDGGVVWRARVTMLCGAIAASRLVDRLAGNQSMDETPYLDFIMEHRRHLWLWGESAVPYFLMVFWYLGTRPRLEIEGENLLAFGFVQNVAIANTSRDVEIGIPNPFYTVEECLNQSLGLKPDLFGLDSFRHVSYTVLSAVHLLVRAQRRQALALVWHDVVELGHYRIDTPDGAEFLRYRADKGTWACSHLPKPTSWSWLRAQRTPAIARASELLPQPFTHDPRLPLLFLLCHPHRVTMDFVLWLDDQLLAEKVSG